MLQQIEKLSAESAERLNYLNANDTSKPKNIIPVLPERRSMESINKITTSTQMDKDDIPHSLLKREKSSRSEIKEAAVNWFRETQIDNVTVPNQNRFAEWFHGLISRSEAERLLKYRTVGCYLIRVSERLFGYTLSFKAETRCRHYMIDQLKNGKFIIIGEPKVHRSLHDMILYHRKVKISNWDHLLTLSCGQTS
uniref:SH2 domain-containing protein n=1 Tax=Arion vulgaris TaxID=1028688 RepID=A0A0B7B4T0_9EUPU